MKATRRPAGVGPAPGGCSARLLQQATGLGPAGDALTTLQDRLAAAALAWMVWSGAEDLGLFHGNASWRDSLDQALRQRRARARGRAMASRFTTPGLEGLAWPVAGGDLLVLLTQADRGMAAILPRDPALAILAEWQELLAATGD